MPPGVRIHQAEGKEPRVLRLRTGRQTPRFCLLPPGNRPAENGLENPNLAASPEDLQKNWSRKGSASWTNTRILPRKSRHSSWHHVRSCGAFVSAEPDIEPNTLTARERAAGPRHGAFAPQTLHKQTPSSVDAGSRALRSVTRCGRRTSLLGNRDETPMETPSLLESIQPLYFCELSPAQICGGSTDLPARKRACQITVMFSGALVSDSYPGGFFCQMLSGYNNQVHRRYKISLLF